MTKATHSLLDDNGADNRRRVHLREISGNAEQSLETVGQDLRTARLRYGEDLATVSRALKIRKDHLEALEEDRIEDLPGRAYAVGFVRSYSNYLGLDVNECVERFKRETQGRGETSLPVMETPIEDERRLPWGWLIVAAAVVILVGYGVYYLVTEPRSLANQPVTAVPEQIAPKIAHATIKPATHIIKPAPLATATAKAAVAVPGQAPQLSPSVTANAPPVTPATGAPTTPANAAPLPKGQAYGLRNTTARVVLRVHAATTVHVEGRGGKVYIDRPLQPGDTYAVPLLPGVALSTPNGDAVELDLDGQSMGMATKTGAASALPLDPQSVADHANPPG